MMPARPARLRVILALSACAASCSLASADIEPSLTSYDFNADGAQDRIVAHPVYSPSGASAGHIRVFSGADLSLLYGIHSNEANDAFGVSVAALGDIDGDGASDFAVGAPLSDRNGWESGRVYVFSGFTGACDECDEPIP